MVLKTTGEKIELHCFLSIVINIKIITLADNENEIKGERPGEREKGWRLETEYRMGNTKLKPNAQALACITIYPLFKFPRRSPPPLLSFRIIMKWDRS